MPLINGIKFKIYDLDTKVSFKERLASTLDTLPEYLYFPDESSLSEFYLKNVTTLEPKGVIMGLDPIYINESILDMIFTEN